MPVQRANPSHAAGASGLRREKKRQGGYKTLKIWARNFSNISMENKVSRVLIIGAGGVGRVVTHKCAQLPEVFSDIWLASRTQAKCDQIAAEVGGGKVQTAQVDADKVPELVALIRRIEPKMIINVALPYQDLTIMDACLETGIHYLDTANYEPRDEAKFEYKWQWAYQTTSRRPA